MYHMAMPPHYGGAAHTPIMHPTLFPGPLLPPGSHNQTMHQYSNQSAIEKPSISAPMMHSVTSRNGTLMSQAPNAYIQQPSVYVNPYMQQHSANVHNNVNSHHVHHPQHMQVHSHMHGFPMQNTANNLSVMPVNQQSRPQDYSYNQRLPLSVDEELMEDITTSHLGYLETEDSPHKMEQREKLENLIMEYLSITPHSHKFMFEQVLNVLEQSVNTKSNFCAHEAACAFDALAHYAANLISQPWRREFREIKLYNGFWVHQVSSHIVGAESILELIGYTSVTCSKTPLSTEHHPSSALGKTYPNHYVLQDVLDPDLISRLALDCMIAYCELQCLNKIKDGVSEYGLSWSQILQFRQLYVGGIDVTLRQLLFTLRQRVAPPPAYSLMSPDSCNPANPPPIPVRQSSSAYISSKPTTPTGSVNKQVSPMTNTGGEHNKDVNKSDQIYTTNDDNLISPKSVGATRKIRTLDAPDGGVGPTARIGSSYSSSRVPTARLIDLDSSQENLPHPHCKSSHHLLPKVLPHKTVSKSAHYNLPIEQEDFSPPALEPPMEAFQAGTLEEHLEATLSLVKNSSRNNGSGSRNNPDDRNNIPDRNSLESWDFVFRGLEKKGYNKDIGDRGDILHDISKQKNNFAGSSNKNASTTRMNVGGSNPNNVNLNIHSQHQTKKDSAKNRPLTINQALQQFTLNATKERVDNNSTSGSSIAKNNSIGHAYLHENHNKRASLYDNLSAGGFETAPQSSSDEYDTAADRRIPASTLRKINNSARTDNISSRSSDSYKNEVGKKRETSKGVKNAGTTTLNSSYASATKVSNAPGIGTNNKPIYSVSKATGICSSYDNNGTPVGVSATNDVSVDEPTSTSIQRDSVTWSCTTCTFINSSVTSVCEMCGKSRDPGPDTKPLVSGGKQCPLCTLINDRETDSCSACGGDLKGSSTYI